MYKYESLHASQLPRERFVFLAKFITTKYLKQEVDDDLSICEDERSPWRNDVSIPNGKVPHGLRWRR